MADVKATDPVRLPKCDADWVSEYWGGCQAPSRYRVERPGEGYSPGEACPAHLADLIAYLVDGEDVPVTVHVRWDEPTPTNPIPPTCTGETS